MSSRTRAVVFGLGALCCAGLSAALAGSAPPAAQGLDQLRPVVVTGRALSRGEAIARKDLGEALEERRVPAAFAPPDALAAPVEALGRKLATPLPPGSYLTAAHFATGPSQREDAPGPPRGTTPVELTVAGAGALETARAGRPGLVDVVVTGEPGPGPGLGRTYVAARGVPLLELRGAPTDTGLGADRWVATLALRRTQALELIRAEGVAGSIRLLAR